MALLAQLVSAFDLSGRAQLVKAWGDSAVSVPAVTASRLEVIDLDAGAVLYTKGTGSAVPASLTKLMTAYILAQHRPTMDALAETTTFSSSDSADAATYNLVVGDVISLHSLLGNMLLPSDNASASAIARVIGLELLGGAGTDSEARARFVAEMNTQAAALGMASSSFVNAHGVGSINQSTPADINRLAAVLAKTRVVRDLWRFTLFRFAVVRGGSTTTLTAAASNDLDGRVGIIGGKTGTVGSAINLTVLWEAPNGHLIASTVFSSASDAQRFSDTETLLSSAVVDYPSLATPSTPFSPAFLFDTLGMSGAWFDASDTAHMWQDEAGTAPVTMAGQEVGKWSPSAGSAGYFRQAISSKRPLYQSGGLAFDGTDDYLDFGAGSFGSASLFADAGQRFMVAQRASFVSGAANTLLSRAGSTAASRTMQSYVNRTNGGDPYLNVRGTINGADADNLGSGPTAIDFWWDGNAGAHVRSNIGSRHLIVGTAADESEQNITLGGRTGGASDFLSGSVSQIVIVDGYNADVFRRLRDWSNGATINAYPYSAGMVEEELTAVGVIAGTPVLGTPELSVGIEIYALSASGITAGGPTVGQPFVAQNHVLVGATIESGSPYIGAPILTDNDAGAILPDGITSGAPNLGSPTLTQNHALLGGAIAAGAPVFGTPTLAQQHAMMAIGVASAAPTLGTPTLVSVAPGGSIIWPTESDVRLGVAYGPTGTEYTGTMAGVGGTYPTEESIAAAVVSALQGTTIPANIKQVNDVTVQGAGTKLNPWKPV